MQYYILFSIEPCVNGAAAERPSGWPTGHCELGARLLRPMLPSSSSDLGSRHSFAAGKRAARWAVRVDGSQDRP